MQICHIFTFEGLKLQKNDLFGQSSGRSGSKSWTLAKLFFFNNHDSSQKESLPALKLSYRKMSKILQVNDSIQNKWPRSRYGQKNRYFGWSRSNARSLVQFLRIASLQGPSINHPLILTYGHTFACAFKPLFRKVIKYDNLSNRYVRNSSQYSIFFILSKSEIYPK